MVRNPFGSVIWNPTFPAQRNWSERKSLVSRCSVKPPIPAPGRLGESRWQHRPSRKAWNSRSARPCPEMCDACSEAISSPISEILLKEPFESFVLK